MIAILVSVFYYCLLIVNGRLLRYIVTQNVTARWQPYLLIAVTTFQVLGCSLENGQVKHFYGPLAYWSVLTILSLWSVATLGRTTTNPCAPVLQYMQGLLTAKEMIFRILFQVAGGLLSYQYAKLFWRLGLHDGHIQRYEAVTCASDLSVSPVMGFNIEFSFVLIDVLMALVVFSDYFVIELVSKISFVNYLVVLGLHLTGMYGNPLNATNQTFGCPGTTIPEHLFVYWCGPFLAIIVGFMMHQYALQNWESFRRKIREISYNTRHVAKSVVSMSGEKLENGSVPDKNANVKSSVHAQNHDLHQRKRKTKQEKAA